LLTLSGCIDEFIPVGTPQQRGLLVVDGTITNGQSVFTLSRSVGISEKLSGEVMINDATVAIETDDGNSIPAHPAGEGKYMAQMGNLDINRQYRLSFTTGGDHYQSEYLTPIMTAEIDSLYPVKEEQGAPVIICLSTHDPEDNSKYYSWLYHETWEVKAELYANARWKDSKQDSIIFHSLHTSENTYYCWGRDSSKTLILGNAEKLSQNILIGQKIAAIPSNHDKLSILYHIEAEQRQIREAAYRYFLEMQRNVERTGSIFSPVLTAGMKGNIRCTDDPDRIIIGYVDVSSTTRKDRYVGGTFYEPPVEHCIKDMAIYIYLNTAIYYCPPPPLPHYRLDEAPLSCVDCKTRENASKNRPEGWPTEHL
jgi:hypothetical protein